MYRYNNRKDENGEKLSAIMKLNAPCAIVGKRLTWNEPTGKLVAPRRALTERKRSAKGVERKSQLALRLAGFFVFGLLCLYGLGGKADFGTVIIDFIAARNLSHASGPSIISG